MQNISDPVELFFKTYEQNISTGNIPALLAQFADPFLAAIPQGARVVSAADYAKALPVRHELFHRLGCRSTSLVDLHPIPLSSRFTLALTKWRMVFDGTESGPRELSIDTAFIVDTGTGAPQIVLYLPNEDIMEVLKNHGIAPA